MTVADENVRNNFDMVVVNARRSTPVGGNTASVPGAMTLTDLEGLLKNLRLARPDERSDKARFYAVAITALEITIGRFAHDVEHESNLRIAYERMTDKLLDVYGYFKYWIDRG